jgi:hypothetical protein
LNWGKTHGHNGKGWRKGVRAGHAPLESSRLEPGDIYPMRLRLSGIE